MIADHCPGMKAALSTTSALALALTFAACATPPAGSPPAETSSTPSAQAQIGPGDVTGQTLGTRLYGQLASGGDNIVISPVSLMGAFGVVAEGARGETRGAILSSLGLPDRAGLGGELGGLLRGLQSDADGATLSVANAVWVQRDFPLNPVFVQAARANYGAEARPVDFQGAPQASADTINSWVSQATRTRIPDLISRSAINADTRLVVTNAVYFLGDWEQPFNAGATRSEPFHLAGGRSISTPLMYRQGGYRLLETADLQVLDLPYKGDRLSMTVLLPRERNGLSMLERRLDADLAGWLSALDGQDVRSVRVFLPKLQAELSYQLNPQLTALGMGLAFSNQADLRGIADAPLTISQVVHKTFLRIDEKGTEAAAATGLIIETTSAPITPPPTFRADHPFVFLIRDRETGAVLFMGRITRPEAPPS